MAEPDQAGVVPSAYFVADGDVLLPDPVAQGPWGPTLSGHVVGGILARAVEQAGGGDGLQPARLTVDLLRPTAIAPLEVRTTVQREGRRIRLVDAALVQNRDVVSRASAVFLRRGEQPTGDIWSSPVTMPALPPDPGPLPADLPMFVWGFGGGAPRAGSSASPSGTTAVPSTPGYGSCVRWCPARPSARSSRRPWPPMPPVR